MAAFEAVEAEKAARERAQNALESFIYETSMAPSLSKGRTLVERRFPEDKLEQEEWSVLVTAEELESIRDKLSEANTWAEDEADFNTKASEYEDKLKPLKEVTKDLFYRHEEARVSRGARSGREAGARRRGVG